MFLFINSILDSNTSITIGKKCSNFILTKLSVVTLQYIMKFLPQGVNVFLAQLNCQEQKWRSKELDESHVLMRKSDLC